jgi:hypothetical protein
MLHSRVPFRAVARALSFGDWLGKPVLVYLPSLGRSPDGGHGRVSYHPRGRVEKLGLRKMLKGVHRLTLEEGPPVFLSFTSRNFRLKGKPLNILFFFSRLSDNSVVVHEVLART